MKRSLILLLVLSIMCCLSTVSNAQWITIEGDNSGDYEKLYLDYAKNLDEQKQSETPSIINIDNSIALMDLNLDGVPEFLKLSTVYAVYAHTFARKAAYIRNGEIIEQAIDFNGVPYEGCFVTNTQTGESELYSIYSPGDLQYLPMYDYLTFDTKNGFASYRHPFYKGDNSPEHIEYKNKWSECYTVVTRPYAVVDVETSYYDAMEMLLKKYRDSLADNQIASSWAWADIDEAKELGIIPEEMYGQDLTQNITRAEFAAIAYKLTRILASYRYDWMTGSFDDIAGNVYENYIRGAASLGITRGTGEKEGLKLFSPDLHLTREQLATMLCRAIKAAKKLEEHIDIELNSSGAPIFADSYLVSDYAKDSVNFLTKYGIIQGVDDYNVAPLDYATREQAILLALRIHNAYDVLTSPCNELKINEDVLENCEYTTVGELISGFEEDKYTLEELLSKLGVDNYQEGTYKGLGGLGSFCFEWNNYGIMISCPREKIAINASPYLEIEKGMISCFPQYVDPLVRADDPVLIRSLEVQSVNLTCTELSLNYPDGYSSLCATIFPARISDVEYNWSSSDANVADIDLMAEDGKTDTVIVRAKNPGTAYITVQVRDENKTCSSECKVMVK